MYPTYAAGTDYEPCSPESETPEHVDFYVRDVNDTYGTNDRAGVELFAVSEDGREWPVVTVIPGKRIRVHEVANALGIQGDDGDGYPGVKKV